MRLLQWGNNCIGHRGFGVPLRGAAGGTEGTRNTPRGPSVVFALTAVFCLPAIADSGLAGPNSPAFTQCQPECPPLDYWVVGTHGCPQQGVPCATTDLFDFSHVGSDRRLRRGNLDAFLQWLEPGVPVCVVVHGSYTRRRSLLNETDEVYCWLRGAAADRPLNVVFFTWPSEPPTVLLPHLDFGILGQRASFNGFYLAALVQRIPPQTPVSYFGHSHGARTVAAALHLLAGGAVQDYALPSGERRRGERSALPPEHTRLTTRRTGSPPGCCRRTRVVLAAAAIDHHWLDPGQRFERALCPAEGLLNLRNRDDRALGLYPARKLFSHRALGRAGFQQKDLQLLGDQSQKVAELDVTALIGRGHFWHNYYRRRQVAAAIVPYLYFDAPQPAESLPHRNRRPILHSSSSPRQAVARRR